MKKLSKRFKIEKSKILKSKLYPIDVAINLVKSTSSAKFNESIEAHISLNIDPKYTNQQLRNNLILPHGTGKLIKIAYLDGKNEFLEDKNLGIEQLKNEVLLSEISKGILNFDILLATPEMMPKLAKFGRILGPKGLMPSPKAGTVTTTLEHTIKEFKHGKFEYRADKMGIVHIIFGKSNFSEYKLIENLKAFYSSIYNNKPLGVKGKYFKSLIICSTMGPAISLNLESFQ